MSYDNYPGTASTLHIRRPPWPLLLFITVVFLLSYNHLSFARHSIGNYLGTQDELIEHVVQGSLIHRIAILLLGIVAITSLAYHRASGCLRVEGSLGWLLLAFATWIFLSPIWSEDLTLTLRRVVAFGILWIAAVAVVRRATLREIILWTFFNTALFLLIGIAAEVVFENFHPFASGYRFSGTMHPNYQGMQCGLLLLSGVAAADMEKHNNTLFRACALAGFGFLILTKSRTAFAATLFALAVYFAAVWSRRSLTAMVYGLTIIACVLFLFVWVGLLPGLRSAVLLGRDSPASVDSLSDRTMIWKDLGYYIRQRPLLGYGYRGFWTPTHISVISDEEKEAIPSSHSTYLQYLLTLGPVGVVAYVLLLFAGIKRAFRSHRLSGNPALAFCGALLVFCALDGFLEVVIIEGSPLMFPCMVILTWLAFVPLGQTPAVGYGSRRRLNV